MHAKNLLVDDGGDRHAVEAIGECLPYFDIVPKKAPAFSAQKRVKTLGRGTVPPFALVEEPVDFVDRSTLVVAAKEEKVFRKLDLECKQQTNCFQRLLAAVDIVPKEQVIGIRWKATIPARVTLRNAREKKTQVDALEQAQEIIVLPVDVTTNFNRGF